MAKIKKRNALPPAAALGLRFVIHGAVGVLLVVGVALLGALFMEKGTLPHEARMVIGFAGVFLGGFAAALLTALREKGHLLPYAGITAAVYCFELLMLGAILYPASWLGGNILMTLTLAVAGCLLGALISLGWGSKKHGKYR